MSTLWQYIQTDKAGNVPSDPQDYPLQIDKNTQVLHGLAGHFATYSNEAAPDLTVKVAAGAISLADGTQLVKGIQSLGPLVAPTTNPRHDIVYIDLTTGNAAVATGAEAGAPVDPVLANDQWASARIVWSVAMPTINPVDLQDMRGITRGGGGGWKFVSETEWASGASIIVPLDGDSDQDYRIRLYSLSPSAAADLQLLLYGPNGTGGGGQFVNLIDYGIDGWGEGAIAASGQAFSLQSSAVLTTQSVGGGQALTATLLLHNTRDTVEQMQGDLAMKYKDSSARTVILNGRCDLNDKGLVDQVGFQWSAGNAAAGRIQIQKQTSPRS